MAQKYEMKVPPMKFPLLENIGFISKRHMRKFPVT